MLLMSSKAIATMAIVAVVVVIIIIAAVAGVLLLGKSSTSTVTSSTMSTSSTSTPSTSIASQSTSTSSSISTTSISSTVSSGSANLTAIQAANTIHISEIESRNIPLVLTQYQPHAVVVWSGNTGGLGGTYSGTENIEILYSGALSTAKTISLTVQNFSASSVSSTQANSTYDMNMTGTSPILGNLSGHIQVEIAWVYNGTGWAIQSENWNYVTFVTTVAGGATTFPQWHTPSRESPDAFKNFVFHFGGPAYAFVIFGYVGVLAALMLTFMFRRNRSAKPISIRSKEN